MSNLTNWDAFDDGRRRGYCMVPGIPGTKRTLVSWGPYQTRRPSEDEIATWKRRTPRVQPIVVTGAISGFVVVDCDGLYGYINLGKRGGLPQTVIVQTPRGDFHEHYWFKYPPDMGTIHGFVGGYDKDLPSVDLRADGNIAVYPGGTNKDGVLYRFKEGHGPDEIEIAVMPAWLHDYIGRHNEKLARQEIERLERLAEAERLAELRKNSVVQRVREQQGIQDVNQARMQRYAEAARRNQIAKVEAAAHGERNAQLFKSAAALAAFINEGVWGESDIELELTRAATICGLDRDPECGPIGIRRTIRSGVHRGINNRITLPDCPYSRKVRL